MTKKKKSEPKKKVQRYVHKGKLEFMKKEGWKQVEITDPVMKKTIARNDDLVLVEK